MVGTNKKFSNRKSDPSGVGPYQFEISELTAGARDIHNFRQTEYMYTTEKGWDSMEITNESTDVPIRVIINENQEVYIPPNSVQSINQAGMYHFQFINDSETATLDNGSAYFEVMKEPLGADEQARQKSNQTPVSQVVEHFTGLDIDI
jgi:hypothetical protein